MTFHALDVVLLYPGRTWRVGRTLCGRDGFVSALDDQVDCDDCRRLLSRGANVVAEARVGTPQHNAMLRELLTIPWVREAYDAAMRDEGATEAHVAGKTRIQALVEASSLGTPAAKRARASTPQEVADQIVERAERDRGTSPEA